MKFIDFFLLFIYSFIFSADYPTIMGFEPLVNQRLLPPTFPRYTKIKSRKESTEYLSHLVTRLRTICNVRDCVTFHAALVSFFFLKNFI